MFSLSDSKLQRVALYARVSTEEQAERQTVDTQTHFLRRHAELYGIDNAILYVDDGVSGTLPLAERDDGKRLLADAKAGVITSVLFTRVDRFARSLAVLLDAYEELDALGVSIRSANEPFDTSTPMGRFMMQLLGAMAELDRSNTLEKLTGGRDRVARTGEWVNGPIPYGYDLDEDRRLIPSLRCAVDGLTESDVVRDIFLRIAEGATMGEEVRRLNTLGIPFTIRYAPRKSKRLETATTRAPRASAPRWYLGRITHLLHNPVYKGMHEVASKHGAVTVAVPPIIAPDVWEQTQARLLKNRQLSRRPTDRPYLLRGLIRCGNCGTTYVGTVKKARPATGHPSEHRYYICDAAKGSQQRIRVTTDRPRCRQLAAADLERQIWEDCRHFILHPQDAIDEVRVQLAARRTAAIGDEERRRTLTRDLAEKGSERESIMTLFRRGRISMAEAERQLDAIAEETIELRREIERLTREADLAAAYEEQLVSAGHLLAEFQSKVAEIEEQDDRETKRAIMERLVRKVTVTTTDYTTKPRAAKIHVEYVFPSPDSLGGSKQKHECFDNEDQAAAAGYRKARN